MLKPEHHSLLSLLSRTQMQRTCVFASYAFCFDYELKFNLIIDGPRWSFFVVWTLEQKKAEAMHDSS